MLKEIRSSGSRCVWVGPPDAARKPFASNLTQGVREVRQLVENNNCVFIDSTKVTKYPGGRNDGIHYGAKESAEWGGKVAAEIQKHLPNLAPQETKFSSEKSKETTAPAIQ